MVHASGLADREDERVAVATLALAQAQLEGGDWPDLAALERTECQEDSFLLQLPIGSGVVVPLEVGMHPARPQSMALEAELLAHTVRAHLDEASFTIRRIDRTRRVVEALAAAVRTRGAPIEVVGASYEAQTSAWGFPMGRIEIELEYPGEDLRSAARTIAVGTLKRLRDEIAELGERVALRAAMRAALDRQGATAFVEPVAAAAVRWFGLDPMTVHRRALDHPYSGSGMNEASFNPRWRGSMLCASFALGDGVEWWYDCLSIRPPWPDTLLVAAAGRKVCDLVEHAVLAGAVVIEGTSHPHSCALRVDSRAPLLLMPDGALVEMPEADRETVLALITKAEPAP